MFSKSFLFSLTLKIDHFHAFLRLLTFLKSVQQKQIFAIFWLKQNKKFPLGFLVLIKGDVEVFKRRQKREYNFCFQEYVFFFQNKKYKNIIGFLSLVRLSLPSSSM